MSVDYIHRLERAIIMDVKKEIVLFTDNDVQLEVPITPERETV